MKNIYEMFDWRTSLIDNFKKMSLSEKEVMIILLVDVLKRQDIKMITPDILALKLNYPFNDIDNLYTNLIKKGFIEIKQNGNILISLEPLKKKLFSLTYEEIKKEEDSNFDTREINDLLVLFENEFGRKLTSFETSSVKEWFKEGNDSSKIKEALDVAKLAKMLSINYIDKVLIQWRRREEIAKSGHSSLSEKWRKNLDETIEIANLNWLDEE